MTSIVEEKKPLLANIQQSISKIWRSIYPPLPENITERKKVLVMDFLMRIIIFLPMKILGIIGGSKYQLMWFRFIHDKIAPLINDKGLGEDEHMKVTQSTFSGIPVRVYEPKQRKGDGAILFIHGGGFVIMSPATHDYPARQMAAQSGLLLISIDYRLAPQHKYPAAVEDCERAAVHFLTKAYKDYAVDPHKTVIMGDSAGGNLTAVTTQRLRKLHVPQPKLQILIYPWTQILDFKMPSYQLEKRCEGTSLLTPSMMAKFTLHYLIGADINHYVQDLLDNKHITPELRHSPSFNHVQWRHLPMAYRSDHSVYEQHDGLEPAAPNMELYSRLQPYLLDPNVSPLLFPNLEGSPASMVLTVGIDPLLDEGVLFAERFKKARVKVLHKHYPTGFHGVFAASKMDVCDEGIRDMVTFIHDNLYD